MAKTFCIVGIIVAGQAAVDGLAEQRDQVVADVAAGTAFLEIVGSNMGKAQGIMAARLVPYLRYYSSKQLLDDHGEWPLVLVVFDNELAESNFHGVARREMDRAGVDLPLWVSHADMLERRDLWERRGATRMCWS